MPLYLVFLSLAMLSSCNITKFGFVRLSLMSTPAITMSQVSPSVPVSLVSSPTFKFSGLKPGSKVTIFRDACRTSLASFTAQSSEQDFTIPSLNQGLHTLYAQETTSSTRSQCTSGFKYQVSGTPFVSTWQTTTNNETITLPLVEGFQYFMLVDWGDGTPETMITSFNDPANSHTYSSPGTHTMTIKGTAEAWRFRNHPDRTKIFTVPELGDLGWRDLKEAFFGCTNLTLFAGGNTSRVTTMTGMFRDSPSVQPQIANWDTSQVTELNSMFYGSTMADPDVSQWDVSKVTNFSTMFFRAENARPDTSQWNTSSATDFRRVFDGAKVANPDVSQWDTSKVTIMEGMFRDTDQANPDVSNWDTSKVTDMQYMFTRSLSAAPDTTNWDTSSVTNMDQLFYRASAANPNTSNWDTSKVTNMYRLFREAPLANPNTSGWNTSKVTNMSQMFYLATAANPDVSNWTFESATDMSAMFNIAMPTAKYSNLLVSIAATATQNGVSFSAAGSRYSATTGAAARAALVSRGWVIVDAGVAP